MTAFPVSIMKSLPVEQTRSRESLDVELRKMESDLRHINNQYRGREQDMSATDRHRKRTLESQKKTLQQQRDAIAKRHDRSNNCCNRCGRCLWTATAPIRYLVGILMLLWSALLIASIVVHLIDQILNSSCGYSCGFAIDKRTFPNPIGILLTQSSKIFPFDYVVFGLIVFWLFWSTIVGIMMIDVRFLCFKVRFVDLFVCICVLAL